MAAKKVGELIKEARTSAGLTQEKLAAAVGLTASEISKAERGELVLTDAALKRIAKATGVTQASLLNAPKGGTTAAKTTATKSTTAAKTSTAKTPTAKTTAAKSTTAKTTAAKSTTAKTTTAAKSTTAKATTAAKSTTAKTTTAKTTAKATTPANANVSMKVTSTEQKLIEAYRTASSDEKKAATKVLKGECSDLITTILGGGAAGAISNNVADLLGDVVGNILGIGKK